MQDTDMWIVDQFSPTHGRTQKIDQVPWPHNTFVKRTSGVDDKLYAVDETNHFYINDGAGWSKPKGDAIDICTDGTQRILLLHQDGRVYDTTNKFFLVETKGENLVQCTSTDRQQIFALNKSGCLHYHNHEKQQWVDLKVCDIEKIQGTVDDVVQLRGGRLCSTAQQKCTEVSDIVDFSMLDEDRSFIKRADGAFYEFSLSENKVLHSIVDVPPHTRFS